MAKCEDSTRRSFRYLPNLITMVRFVLAPALLFLPPLGIVFYVIYLLCGLSDILDGWLARKTGSESKLGATLDSAADFVMVVILLWQLYPIVAPTPAAIVWVAAIAAIALRGSVCGIYSPRRIQLSPYICQ